MRFMFKTDYEDDIRLFPHSGHVLSYGTLLVLLGIFGLNLLPIRFTAVLLLLAYVGSRFVLEVVLHRPPAS